MKLTSGPSGVRSTRVARSTAPPNGSTSSGIAAPVSSSAIALTVKSRRDEIGLDGVGEHDVRLARVVGVRLGAERRDLVDPRSATGVALGTDRSEPLALGPDRIGPSVEAPLDVGRPGIGGQVDVEVLRSAADQQVADGPADEVQTVTRVREPLGQRRQLGEHGREAVWDHDSPGYGSSISSGSTVAVRCSISGSPDYGQLR